MMWNGLKQLRRLLSMKSFHILMAFLGLLAMSFVIFSPSIPYDVKLETGDMALKTVVAPRFIEFQSREDRVRTDDLRKERASLVDPVYSIDESINKSIQSKIVNFFTRAKDYRNDTLKNPDSEIPASLQFISRGEWQPLSELDEKSFASLEYTTLQNLNALLDEGISSVDAPGIRRQILNNVRVLGFDRVSERFVVKVILQYIEPNYVFDEAKTAALVQSEVDSISPFVTLYKEGQPIIYRGEIVTTSHIETLRALNLYGLNANLVKYLGIVIFVLFLMMMYERFVYYFFRAKHADIRQYYLVFIIASIVILIARILLDVKELETISNLHYLIPIPIVAMSVSLLVNSRIALLAGTITSILIAVMLQGDFYLFGFLFLSSAVAGFSSYQVFRRIELIKAGNIVGLFNIGFVVCMGLMLEINDLRWYLSNGVVAFGGGFLSAMITTALLPYLESFFKLTTSLTLLEQSNLNHPLLKKLMINAPGTYQHSLMVATLAEAAAESVGADVVLARIGAYFHDIGKMKRPSFFTENQFSGENPHDALTPRMSKIVISAHTKDGVEMAKRYKLPKVLQDFMIEHHGTSLVSYFYSQAVHDEEDSHGDGPSEEEFRYPGPKPQTKESGIIMLSDSVEAAVRSMSQPTLSKIETLIDKIFQDKLADGQLSDCPLTMKEIRHIRHSFLTLFQGIYHSRIDYDKQLQQLVDER